LSWAIALTTYSSPEGCEQRRAPDLGSGYAEGLWTTRPPPSRVGLRSPPAAPGGDGSGWRIPGGSGGAGGGGSGRGASGSGAGRLGPRLGGLAWGPSGLGAGWAGFGGSGGKPGTRGGVVVG